VTKKNGRADEKNAAHLHGELILHITNKQTDYIFIKMIGREGQTRCEAK